MIRIVIEFMFLGINIFWALLRAHFNPRLTARAKMSLSRAQNIIMPANINSIVLFEHVNKLFEREEFIDSVGVKSAEIKDKFLLEVSTAFCVSLVQGKTAERHAVGRVVQEVEMARNWFRNIVIFFGIKRMFAEAVCKSSPCLSFCRFLHSVHVMTLHDISGDACNSAQFQFDLLRPIAWRLALVGRISKSANATYSAAELRAVLGQLKPTLLFKE